MCACMCVHVRARARAPPPHTHTQKRSKRGEEGGKERGVEAVYHLANPNPYTLRVTWLHSLAWSLTAHVGLEPSKPQQLQQHQPIEGCADGWASWASAAGRQCSGPAGPWAPRHKGARLLPTPTRALRRSCGIARPLVYRMYGGARICNTVVS
jgi:hypothetical protein